MLNYGDGSDRNLFPGLGLDDQILRRAQEQVPTFSFAEFPSEEEEEEEERERLEVLKEEVKETLIRAKKMTNDMVPDFIWTPIINEFDYEYEADPQQYIRIGMSLEKSSNDILSRARKLKRKYADYYQYCDALDDWQDYYEWIEDEYGSWEGFLEAANNGMVAVPVILPPRLKNKKANRGLDKLKIPLSRLDEDAAFTKSELKALLGSVEDQLDIYDDEFEYMSSPMLKAFNRVDQEIAASHDRVRNVRRYAYGNSNPQVDMVLQAMQLGKIDLDYRGVMAHRSLLDEIEAMHENDYTDPAIVEDALLQIGRSAESVRLDGGFGVYVSSRTEKDNEIYSVLSQAGYDVIGMLQNSGMDKTARKLITGQILQMTGEYDEKRTKKMKKAQKKRMKAIEKQFAGDEQIRSVLTHNRVRFDRDDALLSFTMDDILGGDD